jgi:hypothetical protein
MTKDTDNDNDKYYKQVNKQNYKKTIKIEQTKIMIKKGWGALVDE